MNRVFSCQCRWAGVMPCFLLQGISMLVWSGLLLAPIAAVRSAETEAEPEIIGRVVAVEGVCAWPNLTLMPDGTIIAVFHNQPSHGQQEGDVDCWASRDGLHWEKRSTITRHEPNTVRMNHAVGVAKNGDLIVLCSGWTNVKQPERPKQAPFRDAVLRPWVLRSADGGRTWEKRAVFPEADTEAGWMEYVPFGNIWAGEDGLLHASCYQAELEDPSQSTRAKRYRCWHFSSDDDGWTWKPVSVISPRHDETSILPLDGKNWLAAARIDRVELIRSNDDGLTWQEPQPVTGPAELNGNLTRLKDGRLLLSYGVRVNGRRGACAKLSNDDGRTWGPPLRLAHAVDRSDCGYPSSVQLPNGTIATAWYASKTPDHAGYHMGVTVWDAPEK
jgi:BNR repeat protein